MLAICNYGHFWSRELIDWGGKGKGNAGNLRGALRAGARDWHTDFRDQIAIYVLFDDNREAIYVGQTGSGNQRLFSRLRQHSRGALRDRWANFSWFGFLDVDGEGGLKKAAETTSGDTTDAFQADLTGSHKDALDEIEAVLLQIVEPRLNKQGPKWRGTKQFFQYDPFDPEPTRSDLQEILDRIEGKLS